MTYAEGTQVSIERSKGELERTLRRYGATGFLSGWSGPRAMIGFEIGGRQVRMNLQQPDPAEPRFHETPQGRARKGPAAEREWEAETRRLWRSLLLVVKAKLEAVESGISTLEREFLADLVIPGENGATVGERAIACLDNPGKLPPLLQDPGKATR